MEALPASDSARLDEAVKALADDPRPNGVSKLAGSPDLFRVRRGRYRVVFRIDATDRRVTVVRVAHRREVYRLREPMAAPYDVPASLRDFQRTD
jgi:mRNA interferase RelE/StbE